MTTDSPHDITLGQFTAVFVPSGLLLAWALFAPEFGGDLEVTRTRLTMWAVIFLVLPSLVLYLFRGVSQRTANVSHLLWTAALAIFLIHVYWGMFHYYGTVGVTFRGQGAAIFIPNVAVLVVWIIDAVLLWLVAHESHAGMLFHSIVRIAFAILFSLDMIVGRIGAPQILGFVFAGVLVIAVLARYAMTRVRLTA